MTDLNNPLLSKINEIPSLISQIEKVDAEKLAKNLAGKTKAIVFNISLATALTIFKFGFKKGTFKPNKVTIPIYTLMLLGTGYFIYRNREQIKLFSTTYAKELEMLSKPDIVQTNLESQA